MPIDSLKSLNKTITSIKEELNWYFNGSPADCGFKSNFGAFIYFMERGTAPTGGEAFDPEADIDDQLIKATTKHREIRSKLAQCGKDYFLLETYFTYKKHHLQIKHIFDDVAGLVIKQYGEEYILKMITSDYNKCKTIKQKAKKEIDKCMKNYAAMVN